MRLLLSVALLFLVLQLCSAAPALECLTCSEEDNATVAHLAIHHINDNHDHGYKFNIGEVSGVKLEKVDKGCNMELQLLLKETACHTISPGAFEECPERSLGERAVVANCSVLVTVRDFNAIVTKYDCVTRQELTNEEMVRICPDCPTLVPLNDDQGLKSIHEAVKVFNKNTSNENVFVLQEVGRIKAAYISSTGMNYYSEFTLVETICPRESRIAHEACKPMCPDRAQQAFCRSSYSQMNGLYSVQCEFYPPKNTAVPGPGEVQPLCGKILPIPPPTPHGQGPPAPPPQGQGPPAPPPRGLPASPPHSLPVPPPHSHGPPHRPPPHSHGPPQGPPPHSHGPPQGPPPHNHGPPQRPPPTQEQHPHRPPLPRLHYCIPPLAGADPAIHPICPWPQPRPLILPRLNCASLRPKN